MSVLRLLNNPEYKCGLDGDFSFPELSEWLDTAVELRNTLSDSFELSPSTFGRLPGIERGNYRAIVVHPLWFTGFGSGAFSGLVAEAVAEADDGGRFQVAYLDSFNLMRRLSWSVGHFTRQLVTH